MNKVSINSAAVIGIKADLVQVEVVISATESRRNLTIIGLVSSSISQTRHRIVSAFSKSGVDVSKYNMLINLAPANIKKDGSLYDLPIAVGILKSGQFIDIEEYFLNETLFAGELSIHGDIKPINGALVLASEAKRLGMKRIVLSKENCDEASLIQGIDVIGIDSINQLMSYLNNEIQIKSTINTNIEYSTKDQSISIDDIKGQNYAKRALQIAAAGYHNILFFGSPGSGKTMLAQRLPGIMSSMSSKEIIDTTKIYSIAGKLSGVPLITRVN